MNKVPLTIRGAKLLQGELKILKAERPQISAAIAAAREHGDIKENAEYHAAKERQAFLEGKIAELSDKLLRSEIIDERKMPKDKAYLGANVVLKDLKSGEEIAYKLVSTDEADFEQNKISTESPIGRALLGKGAGEKVAAKVPVGTLHYEILSISRD